GFALRDSELNRWNALSMVELKTDHQNGSQATVGIFSTSANYQIRAPLTLSGRYAAKWNISSDNVLASAATTQMLAGRATWDVTRKVDFGVAASTLYSPKFGSQQYGMGV